MIASLTLMLKKLDYQRYWPQLLLKATIMRLLVVVLDLFQDSKFCLKFLKPKNIKIVKDPRFEAI